jgi:hypothetical protein
VRCVHNRASLIFPVPAPVYGRVLHVWTQHKGERLNSESLGYTTVCDGH